LDYVSPLTIGKIVRMKETWFIGIAYGVFYMITVGLISQLLPRLISLEYDNETALAFVTFAALFGCFGSYFWGVLDQMLTTRKASIVYGLWYLATLALQCLPFTRTTTVLSIFMIGFGLGGIGNLGSSIVATKFGRHDFVRAWGVIFPIMSVLRSCAYVLLSLGLSVLGGYQGAYLLFLIVDVIAIALLWKLDDHCVGTFL
nr:hypothetical protein [Eubacterium sp.]